jgi:hypothetical protein
MPPALAQSGNIAPFPGRRPKRDRLPPAIAIPVILALSALGWGVLLQAARLLRAALSG